MKRVFNYIFALILIVCMSVAFVGCVNKTGTTYTTVFPDEYKIIVRVSNGNVFSEETFIKLGNQHYYKYQSYTQNFEELSDTMIQHVGLLDEENNFTNYSYSTQTGWYENSSVSFSNDWFGLNLYCKAPTFKLYNSQQQADESVSGMDCFVYQINNTTYKIAKQSFIKMYYYATTSNGYIKYEVQSITLTDVWNGISTQGLPN